MIEQAHTTDPPSRPQPGRVAEVLMLITFTVICAVMGGLLHIAAELPASTAALSALASLAVIVAANAVVRRKAAVNILNAQIAELRLEIGGLRSARSAAPLNRPQMGMRPITPNLPGMRPGDMARAPHPGRGQPGARPPLPHPQMRTLAPPGPGAASDAQPPLPVVTAETRGDAKDVAKEPGLRSPQIRSAPPSGTAATEQRPSAAAQKSGPPMIPGKAMDWTVRPGVHREPTIRMPAESGPQTRASGPLPLMPAAPPMHAQQPADGSKLGPPAPPTVIKSASPSEIATVSAPVGPSHRQLSPPPPEASGHDAPSSHPATPPVIHGQRDAADHAGGPSAMGDRAPAPSLDNLMMPPADDVPRAAARPGSTAWPRIIPKSPTSPLDLDTMQNLIEQLAGQLDPSTLPLDDAAPPAFSADGPNTLASPAPLQAQDIAAATATPPQRRRDPATVVHGGMPPERSSAPFGQIAVIAEAVEAKRMDVLLDPILGLSDRRARHFELSVRLLTETGDSLTEKQYTPAAAGTGLLGRIDAEKLAHAADVLQRLRARGSAASIFSTIAGESLSDETFSSAFADVLEAEQDNASRLVLTFQQAEARNFTDAHWRAVSDLSRIGLKFALTGVTDLDMDFEVMKRHGFDFIKLDAAVFLDGLPTPTGVIPAADICRHLAGIGLGLIIGGIVEEQDLARILGFGVLLGQGALFGGARSVELERERRAA